MATKDEMKDLWVAWTQDAANQYEPAEDSEADPEEMVEFTTSYADWMLEEYEKRFAATGKRTSRRRKKKPDDDDDDDPEER
jgi:hypothetical protein